VTPTVRREARAGGAGPRAVDRLRTTFPLLAGAIATVRANPRD